MADTFSWACGEWNVITHSDHKVTKVGFHFYFLVVVCLINCFCWGISSMGIPVQVCLNWTPCCFSLPTDRQHRGLVSGLQYRLGWICHVWFWCHQQNFTGTMRLHHHQCHQSAQRTTVVPGPNLDELQIRLVVGLTVLCWWSETADGRWGRSEAMFLLSTDTNGFQIPQCQSKINFIKRFGEVEAYDVYRFPFFL